jgi:hypothetical protein
VLFGQLSVQKSTEKPLEVQTEVWKPAPTKCLILYPIIISQGISQYKSKLDSCKDYLIIYDEIALKIKVCCRLKSDARNQSPLGH